MWQKIRYLLTETINDWQEDKASRLAAALSYYTIFSLPPLLVLALAIAGQVFDRQAAQERLVEQSGQLIGAEGGQGIATLLENASDPDAGLIAGIISVVTLFLGASGAFGQLQDAMNTIWEVQPKPGRGILGTIKDRFFSFTMVLVVGFLLLVSLLLSTTLAALGDVISGLAPEAVFLTRVINFAIGLGVTALLFALIFKVIPDAEIEWRDVWYGAIVTAVLFAIGRWAIGLYLGQSATASTFGAAGSIIVILVWVYYAAQIVFLGAEFTQVYANRYGSRIVPTENAMPVTDEARAQQGIPREEQVRERAQEEQEAVHGAVLQQMRAEREGRVSGWLATERAPAGKRRVSVPTEPAEPWAESAPGWMEDFHQVVVNVLAAPVAVWSAFNGRRGRSLDAD